MKNKANFRIVYLKNDDKRKYLDERFRANSIVSNTIGVVHPALVPSLVHLSARLQDENGETKLSNATLAISKEHLLEANSTIKRDSVKDQLKIIEKYFNKKQLQLKKQKTTMKNLVGSIDFDSGRRKERKIARMIKATIQGDVGSKIRNKSRGQERNTSENRSFLQQDFNNFLAQKRDQFTRQKKIPNPQELEERQLKRLSMISIDKQTVPVREGKPLDLFLFQHSRSIDPLSQDVRTSRTGKLPRATRKAEKRMNLQLSMKNDLEFEWSKLSRIPFNFCTLSP